MKDRNTIYPLNSITFYIRTESATGSYDKVVFDLLTDSDTKYTWISWKFSDWGYFIAYCTRSGGFFQTFPVTPPTGVNKTWEITATTA